MPEYSGQNAAWADSDAAREADDERPPLTAEQVRVLRAAQPMPGPGRIVMAQAVVGGLCALLALVVSSRASVAWSVLYGALAAVVPAAVMARGDDFFDVSYKAQIEHMIRFVQDKMRYSLQFQMTAGQQVHDPARRSSDNIHTSRQLVDLRLASDAAIDCCRTKLQMPRQQADLFIDLERQFARRRNNQRPHAVAVPLFSH